MPSYNFKDISDLKAHGANDEYGNVFSREVIEKFSIEFEDKIYPTENPSVFVFVMSGIWYPDLHRIYQVGVYDAKNKIGKNAYSWASSFSINLCVEGLVPSSWQESLEAIEKQAEVTVKAIRNPLKKVIPVLHVVDYSFEYERWVMVGRKDENWGLAMRRRYYRCSESSINRLVRLLDGLPYQETRNISRAKYNQVFG